MFPFPDSNGPAFTKKEERYGPPLDYVGEKLRHAIEAAHASFNNIKDFVPTNLPREPDFNEHAPEGIKNDMLLSSAAEALHYSIVSYLALYNMLGAAKGNGTFNNIAQKSKGDLKKWLDLIEREGSASGQGNG